MTVARGAGDLLATPGELLLDGVHAAFTLEPRRDQTQGKPFCIPVGVFPWRKTWSNHFQRVVVRLDNVPGFDAVEIHPGNKPGDSHGCILVGETQGPDWVGHSLEEFSALMAQLPESGEITVSG